MSKTEYQIGDIAKIVGLSCDTLRFYEKKGIIKTKKKSNGYRCYSEEDLYRLMYIVYHRKMNSSLEEIDELLGKDVADGSMRDHVRQRLEEEKEELRRHIQAIARLRLVSKDLDSIEKSAKGFSLRPFPRGYVVGRFGCQEDSVREWFRISAGESGLDMTYFYNLFSYSKEEGTPAARLTDQIHPMTKKSRYHKIMSLQKEIDQKVQEKYIGKSYEVLIDGKTFDGKYYIGRTYMQMLEIDGIVYVKNTKECHTGDFIQVEIVDAKEYDLIAEIK